MAITYKDEQVVVFDDFLPTEDFAKVSEFARRVQYVPVNPGLGTNAFRVTDNMSFQGPVVMARLDKHPAPNIDNYPTKSALDLLIERILAAARGLPEHLGKAEEDWDTMTLSPWLYPKGAGLSWHNDAGNYRGAFTFYCHPHWDPHWGGLLLAADSPRSEPPADRRVSHLEYLTKISGGVGRYVLPLPNRCLFTKGGTFHMVGRVDENAGDRVRTSVSGFFLKPELRPAGKKQASAKARR